MSRSGLTVRKRVTRRRHVDLTPVASPIELALYNQGRRVSHLRLGLHYQTGPRYGQQLADLRRAKGPHA